MIAGRYRLIEHLGTGGMGTVWRARDETLNLDVAVKEVRVDGDEAVKRALAEARNAAALRNHPNIVAVHDAVLDGGVPWMVMRLVDGRSLAEELEVRGALHPGEVGRIAAGVLSALGAAHAAGIIHRDVKPANVLLARDGTVLLADFGIAKNHADTRLTATGSFIGTLEYLAPERFDGAPDTPAVDLWSLGATLFEAVEGTSPFRRDTPTATMAAISFKPLPEPTRAGGLTGLVKALLDRDPTTRPDTAAALRMLTPPRTTPVTAKLNPPPASRKPVVLIPIVVAVLVVGGTGVYALTRHNARPPATTDAGQTTPTTTAAHISAGDQAACEAAYAALTAAKPQGKGTSDQDDATSKAFDAASRQAVDAKLKEALSITSVAYGLQSVNDLSASMGNPVPPDHRTNLQNDAWQADCTRLGYAKS
ncbi:serine/threonine-protein kinase [Kitasatospora sp. NPDC028055]|uniref:serine/threonine-protein kinase n=1 Tax=Kitasatospora sp. NPDC028055 TaxID=3155653 RepID=UPI0033F7A8A5